MHRKHIPSYDGKPYAKCIDCQYRKDKKCRGLDPSTLPFDMWCSCVRDFMILYGLSCRFVADASNVSLTTVESIYSGKRTQDIMRETGRMIEFVVFGPPTEHICFLAFAEQSNSAAMLQIELANLHALFAELTEKNKELREENQLKARIINYMLDSSRSEHMFDKLTISSNVSDNTDLIKE